MLLLLNSQVYVSLHYAPLVYCLQRITKNPIAVRHIFRLSGVLISIVNRDEFK